MSFLDSAYLHGKLIVKLFEESNPIKLLKLHQTIHIVILNHAVEIHENLNRQNSLFHPVHCLEMGSNLKTVKHT